YNVTVSTGPCQAYAKIYVHVIPDYNVYVPNTFTPNGDGTNDYYEIFFQNKGAVKLVEFAAFDRWGEKVFESNDISFQWDGRFHGELMTPGIYTYYLKVVFIDNHVIADQKGSITLLR
ncbi:MAG TPA: gliding motility-associated C-terminal domain-containing protein, partial [Chitinophagales bacterium]